MLDKNLQISSNEETLQEIPEENQKKQKMEKESLMCQIHHPFGKRIPQKNSDTSTNKPSTSGFFFHIKSTEKSISNYHINHIRNFFL